jgi:hypothetical protein
MTLDAVEFLRRFLLHVLPRGFMHIRYYGYLANRNRHKNSNASDGCCRKQLSPLPRAVIAGYNTHVRG